MGVARETGLQREDMRGAAEEVAMVAIAAGLDERCELHEDAFISEFPYEDKLGLQNRQRSNHRW